MKGLMKAAYDYSLNSRAIMLASELQMLLLCNKQFDGFTSEREVLENFIEELQDVQKEITAEYFLN